MGEGDVFAAERALMVEAQLGRRGIADARVLQAMGRIPRERFVPQELQEKAYGDFPLPIGFGQTISQPYMVARMTELLGLQGDEKVLEVGTGSGYQTAVLCELAGHVYSVEIVPELAERAQATLTALGYSNFTIASRDGTLGWPEHAPFDAVLVAAGAPEIPPCLLEQLAQGGRLVIPVGYRHLQRLSLVRHTNDGPQITWDTECRFVDLVGQYGWGGDRPCS